MHSLSWEELWIPFKSHNGLLIGSSLSWCPIVCICSSCFSESRARNPMSSPQLALRCDWLLWETPCLLQLNVLHFCLPYICTFVWTLYNDVYSRTQQHTCWFILVDRKTLVIFHPCGAAQLQSDNNILFHFRGLKYQDSTDFFFLFKSDSIRISIGRANCSSLKY